MTKLPTASAVRRFVTCCGYPFWEIALLPSVYRLAILISSQPKLVVVSGRRDF
jgi:hypothetical protein